MSMFKADLCIPEWLDINVYNHKRVVLRLFQICNEAFSKFFSHCQ